MEALQSAVDSSQEEEEEGWEEGREEGREDSLCHGGQARGQARQTLRDSLQAPLETCADEISSLTTKIRSCALDDAVDSRRKIILSAIRWRLGDKEAKDSLERLDRCKNSLSLALSSQNL